jgi:diguanylate cyclase (GGDEF)-like protein
MKRRPSRVAILLFDLDFLKVTNDRDGHEAGDALLRRVAAAARTCARDEDVLARYGGDEFLAVLPGADLRAAAAFAERLRVALEAPPLASFSGGIASVDSDQQATVAALLRAADLALYEAKRGGRNRVVSASVSAEDSGPVAG